MRISIPLWFGTLKVKQYKHLRRDERRGEVPMRQIGSHYVIWRRRTRQTRATDA